MTAIAYDGKVVAADRRVVHKETICPEERIKIRIPEKPVTFKDSEVLFITGCGKSIIISLVTDLVLDGQDPVYFLEKMKEHHFLFTQGESAHVLIACANHTYIIRYAKGVVDRFKVLPSGFPVLLGSGKQGSKLLHVLRPSATPFELVAAAAVAEPFGVGTNIDVYDVADKSYVSHTNTVEELADLVLKVTRRRK